MFSLPGIISDYCASTCGVPQCRYCHNPIPKYQTTTTKPCFPSTARVNLQNGKTVAMSELQIGDSVQTGMNELNFTY